ncbi:MAG: bifunctional histidinol-phosphatase/imidazoleglycerol-phosphate dehydratase HisB [Bacteroidales bacterium]|nr:bifunctional histidinol-phosphatase/imidazoleglycerol-phosphate dehydratase HisB [Candidatus Liminaster caballi]
MKKCLFIDRDGTLIVEPPVTEQVDSFEQVEFLPRVIQNLAFIRKKLDYDFVIVSNQDGLGTPDNPMDRFTAINDLVMRVFHTEGVDFDEMYFDEHTPADNHPNRKPGTGMLRKFIEGNGTEYDLAGSYVIGDRLTDIQLAHNLGCKGILLAQNGSVDDCREWLWEQHNSDGRALINDCALIAEDWDAVAAFLFAGDRRAEVKRTTKETDIRIEVDLDGTGRSEIHTGLGFFDHMLEQIAKHGQMDLTIEVKGDLHVDEHHTIEDTGIALGECIAKALGDKRGIGRYGFCLPMDDCLCQVALDFGGRAWLVWDAEFHREKIGEMPTEMFLHFFKSFSDAARINLNIKAEGDNEHHKIEGIFKALARALKMAKERDIHHFELPSSKGLL